MSALPNDIAAATREAIIERYENTAVRDALTGARDGSLQPAEGFFDLLANAKTIVDERGLVLAGDPRFSVSVAALVWSDPSMATPAVRLVDAEQSVDAKLCCSRIELDLEDESTSFELFYAPDVDTTPPPGGPTPLWISPGGTGDWSGSDAQNAGRLSQLNTFISRAALTGTEVWIRADAGVYDFTSTLTLTNGGARVRGVDVNGNPMMAVFVGKRLVDPNRSHMWNAKTDTAAGVYGIEVFRLNRGADNLTFSHLAFRNLGRGCFRVRQPLSSLTLTDMQVSNVAAFFVNDAGVAAEGATITGLTIQRCVVRGFSKFFAKIQWDSTDILIEDCLGDSEKQDGDNFASGIVFDDNASNIIVRRCTMANIIDSTHAYQNGDGYSGERPNGNILFEDCVAHNCTDGGWDFKGDNIVLRRCVSRENHRNYRLWGIVDLYDCEGYDPRSDNAAPRPPKPFSRAQLSAFYGGIVRAHNCKFSQGNDGPPFRAEQGALLGLDQATINNTTVPSGVSLYVAEDASTDYPPAYIITMKEGSDKTAPVITSPMNFSLNENINGAWLITGSEIAQLRVLPGKDSASFNRWGWRISLPRQDWEKLGPSKSLSADVVLIDIYGNVSQPKTFTVAINDLADDPIGPVEWFQTGSTLTDGTYVPPATDGAWWAVERGHLWQDVEGTIPATRRGDPIARVDDQSGFGHHLTQPDTSYQPVLNDDGGLLSIKFDNTWLDGPENGLKFGKVSCVFMQRRDPNEIQNDNYKIWMVAPSATTGSGANESGWLMSYSGGSFSSWKISGVRIGANGSNIGSRVLHSVITETRVGRMNGVGKVDGADVPSPGNISYPASSTIRIGAGAAGAQAGLFDWYGAAMSNRTEIIETFNRVERQFAGAGGINF